MTTDATTTPPVVPVEERPVVIPDVPATAARRAGAAPGMADEVYLGSRLRYGPVDTSMSGLVDGSLLKAVVVRALLFWLACMLIAVAAAAPFGLFGGFGRAVSLFTGLAAVASWAVFVIPMRLPVSEWHWVVESRSEASRTAYGEILRAFAERRPPADMEPRRAVRGTDRHGREYLRAKQGRYVAHVSAFAYGSDLFVGWTMWWQAMPAVVLWDYLRQLAAAVLANGAVYATVMRADEAKAFREVVHSATRQGVDAAFRNDEVELPTFGASVPVDRVPSWL